MIKGTISNGFEFAFDEVVLDDMRLIDTMAVIVDENSKISERLTATAKASEMILGKAQKEKLYEHIGQLHDGRVPRAEFEAALSEIMASAGKDAEKN